MNPLLFLVIIFFSLFYALSKFLYGLFRTIPGYTFLGTVHYPGDYFIYLAEFAQGKTRWMTSEVLQSNDFPYPTMVRWVNVFWGHIWSFFGLGPIPAYQLTDLIFMLLLFYLSYLMAKELVGKKSAVLTMTIFLTANVFPDIRNSPTGITINTYNFWYNNGNPFNRFITIPHHLIGQCAVLAIILVTIWWWKKQLNGKKRFLLIIPVISGLTLAGINTVHLAFTAGLLALVALVNFRISRPFKLFPTIAQPIISIIPPLLAVIGGLPVIFHLKQVLSTPPYSQMIYWEAFHQLYLTPQQFILGYGPVLVIAPIGLLLFLHKNTPARTTAILFTVAGIGIYFSNIPERLMLGKVRFLLPVINLFLSAMAAITIQGIIAVIPKGKRLVALIFGIIYAGLTIPSFIAQIRDTTGLYSYPNSASYFLPTSFFRVMMIARDTSGPGDVFFIPWPYNSLFPGITGRRSWFSEVLLSSDPQYKGTATYEFFSGKMDITTMKKFLTDNHITRIINFSVYLPEADKLGLIKIYEESGFVVWKVK